MGDKLNDIAESHRAEWERIESEIQGNTDLMAEIRALRKCYGLPCTTPEAQLDWLSRLGNSQGVEAIVQYQDDIAALAKKYSFDNDKGRQTIRSLLEFAAPVETKMLSLGFPTLRVVIQDGVFLGFKPEIDSDTALNNPIVLDEIRSVQREMLLASNPPPHPQPMKDDPKKMDWRPLWEWHKRHPKVTHDEIAKHLGYTPQYVRRKLAELDNGK